MSNLLLLPTLLGNSLRRTRGEMDVFKDLWDFMKERKKWWLAPIIVVLLLIGGALVLSSGSALAPFIYTIF